MKYYLLLIPLGFIISGCPAGDSHQNTLEPIYYPLKEFFEEQAVQLDGNGVLKEITVNGEKEMIKKSLDSEGWLKEFEFFIKADINKPSLIGSYETKRSEKSLIHELKPGEKSEIQRIEVNYEGDEVKDIFFVSKTSNLFYSTETKGAVFIQSQTNKLDNYTIETIQKVVFLKPNKMLITASIDY